MKKIVTIVTFLLIVAMVAGCVESSTPESTPTLTPTPTPIPMGTISASSSPLGAPVHLDEVYKGTTPLTISNVPVGSHTVKVTLSGYEDWSGSITVSAGVTASISPTLTPLTGTISVTTSPVIGAIYIDGKYVGTGQVSREYPLGTYGATFGPVSGYHTPKAQTVTVEVGETLNIVGEYIQLSPAKLEASVSQTISGVSPAIYTLMLNRNTPLFILSIVNTGESPAEYVRVSTRVEGLTDWQTETISDIGPGVSRNVNLMPIIPEDAVTGFDESTYRAVQIKIEYMSIEKELPPMSISQPITIYSKNAVPLGEASIVASELGIPSVWYFYAYYVTPHDPEIRSLATDATTGKYTTDDRAKAIFDALCRKGVSYAYDPNDPIGGSVDYCQFPSQTLELGRGDCDDLSTLYASCLESVGIESKLVFVPGHVFVGYECPETGGWSVVEPTMIEQFLIFSPFSDACESAHEQYIAYKDVATIVDVEYAWQLGIRSGI